MRISRKKRPKKLLIPHFRTNDRIRVPEVRLLDMEGNNIGIMKIEDALRMAAEQESDLIEINPKSEPPVVQLSDFAHFKYQKEKEARKQKSKLHTSELKGIRLSVRIGPGDLETRRKQSEKFLERGDKVKIEIILRGAERQKTPLAYEMISHFTKMLNESIPVKYDQEATRQGNKITAILSRK